MFTYEISRFGEFLECSKVGEFGHGDHIRALCPKGMQRGSACAMAGIPQCSSIKGEMAR